MLSTEPRSPDDRRVTVRAVLEQVHLAGPLSRAELTRLTGLNRSTVKGIVEELAAEGLVTEGDADLRGTPGRPSRLVHARPDRLTVLAVDIEVDALAVATIGLGGYVHRRARVTRAGGEHGPAATVAALAELAGSVTDPSIPLVATGVAVVGTVRRDDGVVREAPNLGWRDVELAALLAEALDVDGPVWVANEADLGALAEHRRGAARGRRDIVYLSCEVGVGGGLVVGGRPLVGAAGYAGEIGHIPVDPEGLPCGCGGRGCWETVAGKAALLRRAGRPLDDPHGDAVDRLLAAAAAGEAAASEAVACLGQWLGVGLAGLVNALNPELVVLGGIYGRALPLLEAPLRERLARHTIGPTAEGVEIVAAALGLDAPLLGAAELALDPVIQRGGPVPVLAPT